MAEVTITRGRSFVAGNRRKWVGDIDIASDADTLSLGSVFKIIESISLSSETNNAIGATISGGVATLQTGGAVNNVRVEITGQ